MSFCFDHHRSQRIGLPESVFCEGKTAAVLSAILEELLSVRKPALLTRLSVEQCARIPVRIRKRLDYDPISRTAYLNGRLKNVCQGTVAVVTAGSSDLSVALEASRTLEFFGMKAEVFCDAGVAGIWRLERHLKRITKADVVIVVAGMDAALCSVLGGLVAAPVIGVPTSVGYGVSEKGESALKSMLLSCAPGIVVMNIDNGYGAACAAFRILALKTKQSSL